jgi:hypothetical protein
VIRVYQFAFQPGFELVVPADTQATEILGTLDGTPKGEGWTAPRVELLTVDQDGRPLAESAFPWLGSHAPVLRRSALDSTRRLMEPHGEYLPMLCESTDLTVFNVLNVLDALDTDRSDVGRLSDNRIIRIKRHVFIPERVRGAGIFKIPQLPLQAVYLTDDVADAIARLGLRGVALGLLWEKPAAQPAEGRSR